MAEQDRVAIVKYNGDLSGTLKKSLQLIGRSLFKEGDSPYIIKPNICTDKDPNGGATVDINLVKALINEILDFNINAEIKIIESDSYEKYIEKAFENHGYYRLVKDYRERNFNISLINLSKEPVTNIRIKGMYVNEINLPDILLESCFLISVAKAKTHKLTQITGVLKNQFGCLPQKDKTAYHRHIDETIVDINSIIRPNLCIIDGIIGMEGVMRGPIKKLGVILCGSNPVCVDSVLAKTMGFKPSKIKHIVLAEKHGLGKIDPIVVGEKIDNVKIKFKTPSLGLAGTVWKNVPDSLYPIFKLVYRKIKK